MRLHLSNCDHHLGEACDCGYLDAAEVARHGRIISVVAAPRGLGFFVDHGSASCFIEAEELPTDILAALASAANLPDAHEVVPLSALSDAVNLNDPRVTVIAQLKAFALSQGIAGGLSPHSAAPILEAQWLA